MKIVEPDRIEERIKQSKWYGNEEVISDCGKLIRCKDCRHWDKGHTEECENSDSVCFHNGWCPPEFFCGDGEERDGEQ